MDRIGLFGLDALDPKGWTYVPGARAGRQGLEIIEERMNNKELEEEQWKRGKKGMNNKEAKEGPWKRGKKIMRTIEEREDQT